MKQENELKLRRIEEILHTLEDGSIHISVNEGKITEIDTANKKNAFPITKHKQLL